MPAGRPVIEDDAFARAIIIQWSRQPPAKPGSLKLRIYNAPPSMD